MLLLKSLICLKGHDNGLRFLAISAACYLLLLILLPVLAQAGILVAILFLAASPILLFSAKRRISDAHLAMPLAIIPLAIFWMNLFGLTFFEHGSKWVLLILAAISSLGFAALNNIRIRKNANYHLGYNGPIDFNQQTQPVAPHTRVEPTLEGQSINRGNSQEPLDFEPSDSISEERLSAYGSNDIQQNHADWLSKASQLLANNLKATYAGIGLLLIVVIIILSLPLFEPDPANEIDEQTKAAEEIKQRLNKIEMPDQFFVMLDQNDAITIAWEGDIKSESELANNGLYWSALNGEGDQDCINLDFSLGKKFRSLQVTVKNAGDYYADFSPVDTKEIVESIANKDRFKLCGYEFALTGTRSLLRKNKKYRDYLGQ